MLTHSSEQIKKQIDEELEMLTNSFATLKQAEAKFKAAMTCLATFTPAALRAFAAIQ